MAIDRWSPLNPQGEGKLAQGGTPRASAERPSTRELTTVRQHAGGAGRVDVDRPFEWRASSAGAKPADEAREGRRRSRRRVAIERADGWPSRATCSYAIASQSFVVSLFRCFV
jgi:hypothetical protein